MIPSKRSAIVVGAGLAGLSAALRLQQAGFDVTVLEQLARPGGRVLSLRREGFTIDCGPDAMTRSYREYQSLAEQVGLADRLTPSSAVLGLVRNGHVIDIDSARMAKLVFTRALTWSGKFRLLRGLLGLREQLKGVDAFCLADSADRDDVQESAQGLAERCFGREVTDYVIDPLVRIVCGSGAPQASRLTALGGLANATAPLINLLGGLDALPFAVAARLDVRYNATVERMIESTGGVAVSYRDIQGQMQELQADVGVIATTFDVAMRIHPALAAIGAGYARELRYLPLVSVSLAYAAPTRSKAYVVQVPTIEDAEMLLIFLQHNKAPDRAPPGSSLITLYTDGMATPHFLPQSDEAITDWARTRIERLFPEVASRFLFANVSRWPVAGYLADPGFWLRTREFMRALPADSRIQLAGDLFGAGSMEAAVVWGKRAAERLVAMQA